MKRAAAYDDVTVLDRYGRPVGGRLLLQAPAAPVHKANSRDVLVLVLAVGLAAAAVIGVGGLFVLLFLRRSERGAASAQPASQDGGPVAGAGERQQPQGPLLLAAPAPGPAADTERRFVRRRKTP